MRIICGFSSARLTLFRSTDIRYNVYNSKCEPDNELYRILIKVRKDLIADSMKGDGPMRNSVIFELFKSNVCHMVKDIGDIPFIIETLKSNEIRDYYNREQYPQAFYLLAMVDYLSRENDLPLCNVYDDMRKQKMNDPIYPQSVLVMAKIMEDDEVIAESLENAIPEFRNFNIARSDVRYVV